MSVSRNIRSQLMNLPSDIITRLPVAQYLWSVLCDDGWVIFREWCKNGPTATDQEIKSIWDDAQRADGPPKFLDEIAAESSLLRREQYLARTTEQEVVVQPKNDVAVPTLPERIETEHLAVMAAAQKGLTHALKAGQLLMDAKGTVAHGEWAGWVEANCSFSLRTAQAYIQVAKAYPTLTDSNAQRSALLSIKEVLNLIAEPKQDLDPSEDGECPQPPSNEPSALADPTPAQSEPVVEVVPAKGCVHSILTGNVEWYTPPKWIEMARTVMGSIDCDPASNALAQETVQASEWYDLERDGLAHDWQGNVWLNPPYERGLIDKFVDRIVEQFQTGTTKQAIVLVDGSTDTRWFHALSSAASAIAFTRGRMRFYSETVESSRPVSGSAFFYLGQNVEMFAQIFGDDCIITMPSKIVTPANSETKKSDGQVKLPQLVIDPEFSTVLPPHRPEESAFLEKSILAEGCRNRLVIWNGILLDGHKRYEICSRHDIPFQTVEKFFADRDEAIDWIQTNQMGRNNLSPEQFKYALGSLYNRAKKRKPLAANAA